MAQLMTLASLLVLFAEVTCPRVDVHAVATLVNIFGNRLLKGLSSIEGNTVFSPIGLSMVMSSFYAGAKGKTKRQLGRLGYRNIDPGTVNIPASFWELRRIIRTSYDEEYQLDILSGLLIAKNYTVSKEFKEHMEAYYDVFLKIVDMKRDEREVIKDLNEWASRKSHKNVQELLCRLPRLAEVFFVNSIFFKGTWKTKFQTSLTTKRLFYNFGNTTGKPTPIMEVRGNFPYALYDGIQVVQLPYVGNRASMLILVPLHRNGLEMLQKRLNSFLPGVKQRLKEKYLSLYLPRFTVDFNRDLKDIFRFSGVTRLFKPNGELTGVSKERDFHLSNIIHKSVINVDEKGSCSGITNQSDSALPRWLYVRNIHTEVHADHPFVFYVIQRETNAVLLMGWVKVL